MAMTTTRELLDAYNQKATACGKPQLSAWNRGKDGLQARIEALDKDMGADEPKPGPDEVPVLELKTDGRKAKNPMQHQLYAMGAEKFKASAEAGYNQVPPNKIPTLTQATKPVMKAAVAVTVPPTEKNPPMKTSTLEQVLVEVSQMPDTSGTTCIKDVSCMLLTAVRCVDEADGRLVGFSYLSILHRVNELYPGCETSNACMRWYLARIKQDYEGFVKYPMPTRFKRPLSLKGK